MRLTGLFLFALLAGCAPAGLSPADWCVETLLARCEGAACCSVASLRPTTCDETFARTICASGYAGDASNVGWNPAAAARYVARLDAARSACGVPTFDEALTAPRTPDGGSCDATTFLGNLSCIGGVCDPMTNECTSRHALGETCAGFCVAGAYCDRISGRCEDLRAGGALCQQDWQCETNDCGDADGRCAAPPPLMADGERCTIFTQCRSQHCVDGLCRALSPVDDYYCDES